MEKECLAQQQSCMWPKEEVLEPPQPREAARKEGTPDGVWGVNYSTASRGNTRGVAVQGEIARGRSPKMWNSSLAIPVQHQPSRSSCRSSASMLGIST